MAVKVKVGIIGGAGYTGGELLRILIHHPGVELVYAHSKSNGGNPVYIVHEDLAGTSELRFQPAFHDEVDVLFLCLGHGESKAFLEENIFRKDLKIIDLSQDFRLKANANDFVYGLVELNRAEIISANKVANPGCFATGIQLGLLPLAARGEIVDDVHISAITGSTGAGQALSGTSHFSWRSNNISIYKAFEHQHLFEITESLVQLQPEMGNSLNFIPFRGDFTRGILASLYMKTNLSIEEVTNMYQTYYDSHPFTSVIETNPNLKQVVNTNKCLLYLQKYNETLHIISVTDNLVKGASGQATQNMNLMFGLDETAGLNLKPVGF